MTRSQHTHSLAHLEEALTVLFCLIDDAYALLNPRAEDYASLKRLSDSEVLALALFQQLRGMESERSFLRDATRFFAHLFPGVAGLHPSSFHRRVRKLRTFLEPLRRVVVPELVGDPETLVVDSTLLAVVHPRQVAQSAGFHGAAWVRWGSFALYGVKLHLLCSPNRVPVPGRSPAFRRRRRTAGRGANPPTCPGSTRPSGATFQIAVLADHQQSPGEPVVLPVRIPP